MALRRSLRHRYIRFLLYIKSFVHFLNNKVVHKGVLKGLLKLKSGKIIFFYTVWQILPSFNFKRPFQHTFVNTLNVFKNLSPLALHIFLEAPSISQVRGF